MSSLTQRLVLALSGVAFACLVLAVSSAVGEDQPQPEPVAGIQNIMNAINHEEWGVFATIKTFAASGAENASADDWKLMRHRAQTMAEIGNVLMDKSPPRGADDAAGMLKWKQHCVEYREACKSLGKALAYKKVDKVSAAITELLQRCEACHKDHKSN
jgi:cytochrome c556